MVVKHNFKDRWTLNVDIILVSQSGKSVKSRINSMTMIFMILMNRSLMMSPCSLSLQNLLSRSPVITRDCFN